MEQQSLLCFGKSANSRVLASGIYWLDWKGAHHSPHFPLSCNEVTALSWTFPRTFCHDNPSSGCSCRRVPAQSLEKLKADKVNNLEAIRQPTLWITLFEHLLQFSVKKCFTKNTLLFAQNSCKKSELNMQGKRGKKVCKFIRKDFNHTVILNKKSYYTRDVFHFILSLLRTLRKNKTEHTLPYISRYL